MTAKKNYTRQSDVRPDSSIVCPYSAMQDVGRSDPPKQTYIPPDRTTDRLDSATTGQYNQYNTGMDSNWPRPDSAMASNGSTSQGCDSPDSERVGWSKSVITI